MKRGLLVCADGLALEGTSVGSPGVRAGEVVFNTSMTGYQEVLSDPSYAEQIVVMTSPHIGNYGVHADDDQAVRPAASGLIARQIASVPSSWRAERSLAEYLAEHEVAALTDVDTRRLTRHLRRKGAMPAALGTDIDEAELRDIAEHTPSMEGRDLTSLVTRPAPLAVDPEGEKIGRVAAVDLGIKQDIVRQLTARGLETHLLPAATSADEILRLEPNGVLLSNGPGDPEPLRHQTELVRRLLGKTPVFGICLGHQVLGLALGANTFKLPFGHHGGNHPVRNLLDGTIEITAQNHGFAVDLWEPGRRPPRRVGVPTPDLLPKSYESEFGSVAPTHQNLNDGTLEGLECREVPAFGIQYHPEAAPGPHEAVRLFDRFLELMEIRGANAAPQ